MRGGVVGVHTTPIVFLYIRSSAAISAHTHLRSSTSPTTSPWEGSPWVSGYLTTLLFTVACYLLTVLAGGTVE